jgi:ribosomal protein S12
VRSEAQKAARRKYEQSEKGKAARKRHEAAYRASGGRAEVEKRRSNKPVSAARKAARVRWAKSAEGKAWFAENQATRRKLEKGIDGEDKFLIVEAYRLAKLRETVTGILWHVDHIIPISKGGMHTISNIQVVPAFWNRQKSNKHTEKFFGA